MKGTSFRNSDNQKSGIPVFGMERRAFFGQAGGGVAGTALSWLLAQDGFFNTSSVRADQKEKVPTSLMIRKPHFAPKAKSCIFLFMYGGPSQVDLWDPKPELIKRHGEVLPNLDDDPLLKVRNPGTLLGSTRQFTQSGSSGLPFSDLFPNLSRCADDIAVIRSMYADSFAHGSGLLQMNTGFIRQGYPSLGSWSIYGLGTMNQNLPAFVVMVDQRGGPISGPPNWNSGFMPATYQGTQFRTSGDPIIDLSPPAGVTLKQQRQQLDFLEGLNRLHREKLPNESLLKARLGTYELAYRMQTHAPEAVDLAQETREVKQQYGLDNPKTEPFGKRCLLARRLVERGVRFVQVYSGGGHGDDTWDAHGNVDKNHEKHCGQTDQPIAALLTDLKRSGLLDETLVVWTGEFGRTVTAQNGVGRDHSPRGFSAWMAGGGIQGGQAYGATDDFGYAAVEKKTHVNDLHATILHLMGLDHTNLTYFHAGRDMRLTDVGGRVIHSIIG